MKKFAERILSKCKKRGKKAVRGTGRNGIVWEWYWVLVGAGGERE
jgi:hypothetical protein